MIFFYFRLYKYKKILHILISKRIILFKIFLYFLELPEFSVVYVMDQKKIIFFISFLKTICEGISFFFMITSRKSKYYIFIAKKF